MGNKRGLVAFWAGKGGQGSSEKVENDLQLWPKLQGREKEDSLWDGRRMGASSVKVRLKIQFLR